LSLKKNSDLYKANVNSFYITVLATFS